MEIHRKPFVTAFNVVKSNIYRIVSLEKKRKEKKEDPLALFFVPCFIPTMHIIKSWPFTEHDVGRICHVLC